MQQVTLYSNDLQEADETSALLCDFQIKSLETKFVNKNKLVKFFSCCCFFSKYDGCLHVVKESG